MRIQIRKADIPPSERDLFERYGEHVIGLVLGGGFTPSDFRFEPCLCEYSNEIHARDRLTERGDLRERHESLTFWLEVGVLVFVILGMVIDALILCRAL